MFTCCIGVSGCPKNCSSYQYTQSFQLVPANFTADDDSSPNQRGETTNDVDVFLSMTASALEEVVRSCLSPQDATCAGDADGGETGENYVDNLDPVEYFDSEDAHFLRCRPLTACGGQEVHAIFGINESATSLGKQDRGEGAINVSVALLDPTDDYVFSGNNRHEQKNPTAHCCCQHPRGNWGRNEDPLDNSRIPQSAHASKHTAYVKMFNLTRIQDRRRRTESDYPYPCFDSPGRVFHLLRSVLNCNQSMNHHRGGLHSASPWYREHNNRTDGASDAADDFVALLVNDPDETIARYVGHDQDQFWDDVEEKEIDELFKFRTGDAAPSYFLHSISRLSGDVFGRFRDSSPPNRTSNRTEMPERYLSSRKTKLFVYRRLPPRDFLTYHHLGQERMYVGCLWETYLENVEDTDLDAGPGPPDESHLLAKRRMVSPPYLSHAQEYPGLLDELLGKLDSLRREARKIPKWTAWPEQNHYANNSWNVFPLCYTFPANDLQKRIFIQKTCAFVPDTTELLQSLGPALRTALFSRLDPRARLGAHTGWSDLANHVLRVHIPLIVPGSKRTDRETKLNGDTYSVGLCGTWVDGCVETHEEGSIICFDDSKVHRAFNYSEDERIVLIIDLARPQNLPIGTATGGHSDDLDAFISGF
ncbi:hypothetical protein ACHAXA_009630 [Cyclostephanos tholiformis]|uniref:Aspartyl/asparaginy/proline hydroxylase domain-containing protein n=1 Tax=Cyclostephanos tholiformis TaxID=382380 RepID=A0ABD3R298_9STRA